MSDHERNWTPQSDTEYDVHDGVWYKREITWELCTSSGCFATRNIRKGNWVKEN